MSKTLEIIKREYITRVRKKSFIILTILMPILMVALMLIPMLLSNFKSGEHKIAVLDENGIFKEKFRNSQNIYFTFIKSDLEALKKNYKPTFEGILYIPKLDIHRPMGIKYYSDKQPGLSLTSYINRQIKSAIKDFRLQDFGLDKKLLKKLDVKLSVDTVILSQEGEKKKNTTVSAGLSYFIGFILYFLLITYGTMVMKGVQEEKTNRIVEIIISSVKPVQLMIGKIIGLAAVALTQILIWMILGTVIFSFSTMAFLPATMTNQAQISADQNVEYLHAETKAESIIAGLKSLNVARLFILFIIYAIGGYLFYSALFAAVGAISDDTNENQSITMPVMLPIIIAFLISINVMEQPSSSLALWTSMIPFFSPIVMMTRIPFGVPTWQIITSILLLFVGVFINILVAAKIYRTAILLYGKKIGFKEVGKWIFHK